MENVIRNTKYGAGLNHLLSGSHTVNTVWMWAALTAVNLTILMQELAIATYPTPVPLRRVTTLTIARTLIAVPARIVRHARAIIIGPGPTGAGLADLITRLRTHRT